eukprot:135133-Heterocapsa_arctica.AAC.1
MPTSSSGWHEGSDDDDIESKMRVLERGSLLHRDRLQPEVDELPGRADLYYLLGGFAPWEAHSYIFGYVFIRFALSLLPCFGRADECCSNDWLHSHRSCLTRL